MEKKKFYFYKKTPIDPELESFISKNEDVAFCAKTVRDVAVFTNKRILVVDKQGLTGKKKEYYSIPYKKIVVYSIETAGTFDLDSEIKLVLSGGLEIELSFARGKELGTLLYEVYNLMNDYVTGHS